MAGRRFAGDDGVWKERPRGSLFQLAGADVSPSSSDLGPTAALPNNRHGQHTLPTMRNRAAWLAPPGRHVSSYKILH
jgi:hypothetical protein